MAWHVYLVCRACKNKKIDYDICTKEKLRKIKRCYTHAVVVRLVKKDNDFCCVKYEWGYKD